MHRYQEKQLKNMQTKAATEFSANMDAYNALGTQVANALKTRDKVSSANGSEINEAMEMIMNECPSEFRSSKYGEVAVDKEGNITVHTLAALRTSLNSCKSKYRMAQARLETCQMNAYRFQDMVDAKNSKKNANTKKNPNPQIKWSVSNTLSTKEEFMWLIYQKPRWCKITAFVYAVISLFSFLGIISSNSSSNKIVTASSSLSLRATSSAASSFPSIRQTPSDTISLTGVEGLSKFNSESSAACFANAFLSFVQPARSLISIFIRFFNSTGNF